MNRTFIDKNTLHINEGKTLVKAGKLMKQMFLLMAFFLIITNVNGKTLYSQQPTVTETLSTVVTTAADVVDATDGLISLREAIAYAGTNGLGSDITFDATVFATPQTITLGSTLTIDKDLTIDGAGKVILDGGDTYDGTTVTTHSGVRIMEISFGRLVKLSNLTFQNGYTANNGGALYNAEYGTLIINNSIFKSNTANKGGAIYNEGYLSLDKTSFSGNTADNGGAVYSAGSSPLLVSGSSFTANQARNGGAISLDADDDSYVAPKIEDSYFIGNTASGNGGAIYSDTSTSGSTLDVAIINSVIHSNTANGGGGIYNNGANVKMSVVNSTVSLNTVITAADGTQIVNNRGNLYLINDIVVGTAGTNNKEILNGNSGSLYLYSTVTGGITSDGTGTLTQWGQTTGAKAEDIFVSTAAAQTDLAIKTSGAAAINGTLAGNILVFSPTMGNGDFYYLRNNTWYKADDDAVTIIFDPADADGNYGLGASNELGVVRKAYNEALNLDEYGIPVSRMSAIACSVYNAGAYAIDSIETPDTMVTTAQDVVNPFDNLISLREAIAYAGANGLGNTITFDATVFATAQTIMLDSTLNIEKNLTIDGAGKVILDGGNTVQIMNIATNQTLTLNDLTFQHGYHIDNGGAIYIDGHSSLTVNNSTFSMNNSTNGAAIYGNTNSSITIDNSNFEDNEATIGAAIYNMGAAVVSNSLFKGNQASSNGGAIDNNDTFTIINSTFSGNRATEKGGAIKTAYMLTVLNSTFNDNTAATGAAIFNDVYACLYLANSVVLNEIENQATTKLNYCIYNTISGSLPTTANSISGKTASDVLESTTLNADGTFHIKADGDAAGSGTLVAKHNTNGNYYFKDGSNGWKQVGNTAQTAAESDLTIITTDQLGVSRLGTVATQYGIYANGAYFVEAVVGTLATPTNLASTYTVDGNIQLSWDAIDCAAGYTVTYQKDGGTIESLPFTTNTNISIPYSEFNTCTFTVTAQPVTTACNNSIWLASQPASYTMQVLTIDNINEFVAFRDGINTGAEFTYKGATIPAGGENITFKLTTDLDLSSVCGADVNGSEVNWIPIGSYTNSLYNRPFKGHFNGKEHLISNLYINAPSSDYLGLFGFVYQGSIDSVNVASGSVNGMGNVGGVCGRFEDGSINYCTNSGSVSGGINVGGVCGFFDDGSINYCTNSGSVGGFDCNVGGVCGEFGVGSINYCTNSGSVSGGYYTGGVCGQSNDSISNSTNSGSVSGGGNVGGVCGQSWGSISNSTNSGGVSGTSFVGGVVGYNIVTVTNAQITNCYYDKQMCTVGGIGGIDEAGQAEGKLTSEMTGLNPTGLTGFTGTDWVFADGMYPRPRGIENTDAAIVGATPIYLYVDQTDNTKYETTTAVITDFTVGIENGVTWTSKAGKVNITNGNVTFVSGGNDTLQASRNGLIYKIVPVCIKLTPVITWADPNPILAGTALSPTQLNATANVAGSFTYSPRAGTVLSAGTHTLYATFTPMNTDEYTSTTASVTIEVAAEVLIDNEPDLQNFRDGINTNADFVYKGYKVPAGGENITFKLTADLDLSGVCYRVDGTPGNDVSWIPIGNDTYRFKGHFNGNHHTISNLYINAPTSGGQGLFDYIRNGSISNLNLANTNVTGLDYVGSVAGFIDNGTITACTNSGSVSGNDNVGGLVGYISGTNAQITACTNSGSVSGIEAVVGGVAGFNDGVITACANSGRVNTVFDLGGVVGKNVGIITHCTNSGGVSGTSSVGGVVGYNTGTDAQITNCYYDKQMCTVGGIEGFDQAGKAEGRLTSEMTGLNPTGLTGLTGTDWVFADGMYPRPNGIENSNAAIVGAMPIFLKNENGVVETVNALSCNFTYSGADSVAWSSTQGNIAFSNGSAAITTFGNDIIAATYGNATKRIAVTMPQITMTGIAIFSTCEDTPSNSQSVIISGSNLPDDVTITAPTAFEICKTENDDYLGTLTISPNNNTLANTTFYVRLAADATPGTHIDSIRVECGCYTKYIPVSGLVGEQPTTLDLQATTSFVCSGENTLLTASVVTTTTGSNEYQWFVEGEATPFATTDTNSISVAPTTATNYLVKAVNRDTLVTNIEVINYSVPFNQLAVGNIITSDSVAVKPADWAMYSATHSDTAVGVVYHISDTLLRVVGLNEVNSIEWGFYNDGRNQTNTPKYATKADAHNDWNGKLNTDSIIAYNNRLTTPYSSTESAVVWAAAQGGYLPAAGELYQLYENRDIVNTSLDTIQGATLFSIPFYWSSSERNFNFAWYIHDGQVDFYFKGGSGNGYYSGRAVCAYAPGTIKQFDNLTIYTECEATSSAVEVIVNPTYSTSFSETACGSYTWNGITYTSSNDYAQTLQTIHGCDSIVTLHLTINHQPTVSDITAPATIVHGEALALTAPQITDNGSTVTAEGWQISDTQNFTGTVENYIGQTLAYTYNNWYLRYYAENGCGTNYSNVVTITVLGYPVVDDITAPDAICNNTALSLTAPNVDFRGQQDLGQGWQLSEDDTFTTYIDPAGMNLDNSYNGWYLRYFATNAAGTTYSNIVNIIVNEEVIINTISDVVYCTGVITDLIPFSVTNTGGTARYEWINDNTAIGLPASGSTNGIERFITANNTNTNIVANITVTPFYEKNGIECEGTPEYFTITVNPGIVLNPISDQTVRNGEFTTAIEFSSLATGGTIQFVWTTDNPSIGINNSGVTAGVHAGIPSFQAVNNGTEPVVATIYIRGYYGNGNVMCDGASVMFRITVLP